MELSEQDILPNGIQLGSARQRNQPAAVLLLAPVRLLWVSVRSVAQCSHRRGMLNIPQQLLHRAVALLEASLTSIRLQSLGQSPIVIA